MLEGSEAGSRFPTTSGWMCSSFLEPARTCPFSWFPGSQAPVALTCTVSTCKQLGVAEILCPLTQFETLRAAKEPSSVSSFSCSPPLSKSGQQAVFKGCLPSPAQPSPPPWVASGPSSSPKAKNRGTPQSKSCSLSILGDGVGY